MSTKDRSKLSTAVDGLLNERSPHLTRAATAPAPDAPVPGKRGTPTKGSPKVMAKQKLRRQKQQRQGAQDVDTQDRYKTTSPQQYRVGGFAGGIESLISEQHGWTDDDWAREIELWVLNDEGLYNWFKQDYPGEEGDEDISQFIQDNWGELKDIIMSTHQEGFERAVDSLLAEDTQVSPKGLSNESTQALISSYRGYIQQLKVSPNNSTLNQQLDLIEATLNKRGVASAALPKRS